MKLQYEKSKEWQKNNRNKCNEYVNKCYHKNPEPFKNAMKKYYSNNKNKILSKHYEYRQKNTIVRQRGLKTKINFCPKCGKKGSLNIYMSLNLKTKNIVSTYRIQHYHEGKRTCCNFGCKKNELELPLLIIKLKNDFEEEFRRIEQ